MNTFAKDLDKDKLFNIATGEAAPDSVVPFLLDIEGTRKKLRDKFIDECD